MGKEVAIFKKIIDVRWSDIDANHHMTHTAYAEFAAHTRVSWMNSIGCSMQHLLDLGYGGVILKEITEYYREISLDEYVTVELFFAGESENHARWKFIHNLYKANGKLAATVTVYGAWINSTIRKISPPPPDLLKSIINLPKTKDFEVL